MSTLPCRLSLYGGSGSCRGKTQWTFHRKVNTLNIWSAQTQRHRRHREWKRCRLKRRHAGASESISPADCVYTCVVLNNHAVVVQHLCVETPPPPPSPRQGSTSCDGGGQNKYHHHHRHHHYRVIRANIFCKQTDSSSLSFTASVATKVGLFVCVKKCWFSSSRERSLSSCFVYVLLFARVCFCLQRRQFVNCRTVVWRHQRLGIACGCVFWKVTTRGNPRGEEHLVKIFICVEVRNLKWGNPL